MQGISTVDGFVETTECLAEMIKYVANEPSVGLFYVQQHTQNAVPNVIHLKNMVVEKSKESVLHTEDLEDSITTIKSMKDCGTPVADDIIQDIRKSLALMSKKQPRRGVIPKSTSGLQTGRTSFRGLATWDQTGVYAKQEGERMTNYFSTMFKNAKERATNFKWPQLDSDELIDIQGEKPLDYPLPLQSVAPTSDSPQPMVESGELHSSIPSSDKPQRGEQDEQVKAISAANNISLFSDNYDDFKANKEAKLEEWLGAMCDDVERLQENI